MIRVAEAEIGVLDLKSSGWTEERPIKTLGCSYKSGYLNWKSYSAVSVNLPQAGEQQWKYTTLLNTNLTDNLLKRGVALDGYIRQEKNCSTDLVIKANKELHGIVISYCVRVRCWIGIR
ncbi:unnamed protein product [Schistosoma curassoni]|uniref:Fimbrial outer membrane usher protein n=1 Tax=Schistosoma curassoni TaxID=6186 RepID=A0A183KPT1_9TREM|nr:unnamed protein product [Schistosoma curassoni]